MKALQLREGLSTRYVLENGDTSQSRTFTGQWVTTGFSSSRGWNLRTHPNITLAEAFAKPSLLRNARAFDVDYGTPRLRAMPGIQSARVVDL